MTRLFLLLSIICILWSACKMNDKKENKNASFVITDARDTVLIFAVDIISTRYQERDMAISADGHDIYFTLGNYNQTARAIVHMHEKQNTWSEAEIMPWSGIYNDIEPFLSPDGYSFFFASDRPVDSDSSRKDFNIWISKRAGEIWQDPSPLDSMINSGVDEFYPSLGKSNNLYFTAAHPGNHGKEDIYLSKIKNGKYSTPVALDSSINSSTYEFNAYISPGEDTILFSSYGRKDDMGGGDLYMSVKDQDGEWQMAHNLGKSINSTSLDYCPYIDYPRQTFYFTSNRFGKKGNRIENITQFKHTADQVLNGLDNIYFMKLSSVK